MEITCVEFRAFDKALSKYFVNKTPAQIHEELTEMCNTHIITAVYHCHDARPVALEVFTKFQDKNLQL